VCVSDPLRYNLKTLV